MDLSPGVISKIPTPFHTYSNISLGGQAVVQWTSLGSLYRLNIVIRFGKRK